MGLRFFFPNLDTLIVFMCLYTFLKTFHAILPFFEGSFGCLALQIHVGHLPWRVPQYVFPHLGHIISFILYSLMKYHLIVYDCAFDFWACCSFHRSAKWV